MSSRLDSLSVKYVVDAIKAGIVPGMSFNLKDIAGEFLSTYISNRHSPVYVLWRAVHNPEGDYHRPTPTEIGTFVATLDPFINPTPEEAVELAAIKSKAWMNPGRGAEIAIYVIDPLQLPIQGGTEVFTRNWADAKPFILGLPRLESIFLKFPWPYPIEHWSGAWSSIVGNAKIEELSKVAASGVSDADLDAVFRTSIVENVDAITAQAGKTMDDQAKRRAKQALIRTIATFAAGIITAGALGPLVGALSAQAIKLPDQIAAAKDLADDLKAQDAAKAAQDRAAAEAEANDFYNRFPGPFEKVGYTADVWRNLTFDQKIAVMQAISKGEKLDPWPGIVQKPAETVEEPPQGTQEQFPTIEEPLPYHVYVEGVSVGVAKDGDAATALAIQNSSIGDRVEIVVRQYYPGTKMLPTIVARILGIRTADSIVPVPPDAQEAVKAMSPDQVRGVIERAEVTAGVQPSGGGFPIWLLAVPAAVYVATK